MMRSGCDIKTEFENGDELKKLREAYCLHILDQVLTGRERVHFNDKAKFNEENKDKVTLDNVFALAKKNTVA
jgi:hypothetical protein